MGLSAENTAWLRSKSYNANRGYLISCDASEVAEKLLEMETRISELEHALTQVLELAQRDSEHFGGQRKDIAERAKETLNI